MKGEIAIQIMTNQNWKASVGNPEMGFVIQLNIGVRNMIPS
jgi:hypothetical protein